MRRNNQWQKKLGHAAALALVGWYLMAPPISNREVNLNAPLAQWQIINSFDTATQCEDSRLALEKKTKRNVPISADTLVLSDTLPIRAKQLFALQMVQSACVATDDPRLKGT